MSENSLASSFPSECRIPYLENNSYIYGKRPPDYSYSTNVPEFEYSHNYRTPRKKSPKVKVETYSKSEAVDRVKENQRGVEDQIRRQENEFAPKAAWAESGRFYGTGQDFLRRQQMIREEIERERREHEYFEAQMKLNKDFEKGLEGKNSSMRRSEGGERHEGGERGERMSKRRLNRGGSKKGRSNRSERSEKEYNKFRNESAKKPEAHYFKTTFAYEVKSMDNKPYTYLNNKSLMQTSKISGSKYSN